MLELFINRVANKIFSQEMGYEMSDYSNLKKWYGKIQSLPHFEENENGAKYLAGAMKGLVKESLF